MFTSIKKPRCFSGALLKSDSFGKRYESAMHAPGKLLNPFGLNPFTVSICSVMQRMFLLLLINYLRCKDEFIFFKRPKLFLVFYKIFFLSDFFSLKIKTQTFDFQGCYFIFIGTF